MPYMNADTGNKVGFRPYGGTNPHAAANLSGLGQGHNPFTPQAWHLHGLGDVGDYFYNRPFDPWELHNGGHLHGLGALGDGPTPTEQAADELLAAGTITQSQHDDIVDDLVSFNEVLGYDPTDQSSWVNAVGLLQNWNHQLQQLEQQATAINNANLQSGTQPTPAFQQFTRDLQQQRSQFENISQTFLNLYRTVTGSVPAGLTGLGILPVVAWAIGAAAAVVAVYVGYQLFQRWAQSQNISQLQAQTASGTQQSSAAVNASLLAALQKAQASGDTVTANSILATLQRTAAQPAAASTTEQWLMTNAKWIGLGLGAIVVLPALLGRRR